MKHKFSLMWRVAVALVLVLSFSLVVAVPAAADNTEAEVWVDDGFISDAAVYAFDPTLTLDTDAFDTIAEGLTAVKDFGKVNVRPGTYDLGTAPLEITNIGVTLKATGTAAETIIDATAITGGSSGSGLTGAGICIGANGVTVDGFTVKDAADADGIKVVGGVINVTIKNNIITFTSPGAGLACGIWIRENNTGATVSGNELDAPNFMIMSEGSSDCTLSGNTFGRGIELQSYYHALTDITITDNIITSSVVRGITFDGWSAYAGGFDEILIQGNTISGTTAGTFPNAAISFCNKATVTNLTITGNDIINNKGCGIGIEATTSWGAGNTINNNNIYGNVSLLTECSAIENKTNTSVDAEENWWGVAVESAIETLVSINVDYSPWLDAAYPDGTSTTEDLITVSLYEGWNLISLSMIPDAPAIETVLADVTVDSVHYYDASIADSDLRWSSYLPGGPSDLATMNDGKGYWVEMSADATLTVLGKELPDPPATPPYYSVVEGWNLIGFKSATAKLASAYLAALYTGAAPDFTVIYRYDAVNQIYKTVAVGDNLEPGIGYWIAVTKAGIIYP